MGKIIGRLLVVMGVPGDVETIGNLIAVMASVAGFTGIWAFVVHGLPWAVFICFGVFFFGIASYLLVTEAYAQRRLPHKIYVGDLSGFQWRDQSGPPKVGFQLLLAMNSMASFEIFFDVISADFTAGGESAKPDKTRTIKGVIAPHGLASITLGTVPVDYTFKDGRVAITVNYGREKDKFTHQMVSVLEFFPVAHLPPEQQGPIQIMRNVVSMDYKRLPHG